MEKVINKNHILTLILMVIPLGGLGVDLYAAGMPALAHDFAVDQTLVRMTISMFLFGLFVGMYWFGLFSDTYGRRIFQLVNALIFMAVSACIALSHSFAWILVLRFVQGVTSGGLQVVARSMITDVFKKEEIPHVTLYATSVWGLGPVIAPWIGGLLSHYYGWRACFYFFMMYGLLMFVMHAFLLKETHHNRLPFRIKRIASDMVEIMLHRSFVVPVLIMSLCYIGLVCYGILGPYYIEIGLHHSSVFYGDVGLVTGLGYLMGTLGCRFLLPKVAQKKILKGAVLSALTVNIVFYSVSVVVNLPLAFLIADIILTCFAFGFMYPIYMAQSLAPFSHKAGIASGLTVSTMLFLSAVSSVGLGFVRIQSMSMFMAVYGVISCLILLLYLADNLIPKKSIS